MFIIPTTIEEVLSEFPYIEEWISTSSVFLKKNINRQKIEFYYSYGYFVSTKDNNERYNREISEFYHSLNFEERFNFELSKVKVNLTMRIGQFIISNRLKKGEIPSLIVNMVKEITKVKMTIEGEIHKNKEIIDSIPPIDKSIISTKQIREGLMKNLYSEKDKFDTDSILDKISNFGIGSLSEKEKEFLDKKSKDF